MLFGMLKDANVGDIVRLSGHVNGHKFKVVNVRDLRLRPLLKDTYRRNPDKIRSMVSVTLFNLSTRCLQTRYFAENIPAMIGE